MKKIRLLLTITLTRMGMELNSLKKNQVYKRTKRKSSLDYSTLGPNYLSEISILREIYRRHLALIYVCVIFVSVVGLAIYFFRQFIWLIKGVIYEQVL